MIKNSNILIQFEREQTKKEKYTYAESLKLVEAMWKEGITLGILPPKDSLEGIEVDIRIARVLNKCLKSL